ncbi:MAG: hypothetical protein ACXWJ2_05610 [Hyphomicrobium sp.]
MTVSNRRRLCVSLVALSLTIAGLARGQDAPPPPPAAAKPASPAPEAKDPKGAAAPVSILPDVPEGEKPAVETPPIAVGDLAAPGIDRLGLVGAGKGGFKPDLWRGTDPAFLMQMLPLLPHRVASLAERRLLRNLLLSPGAPPGALLSDTDAAAASTDQPTEAAKPGDGAAKPEAVSAPLDAATLLAARMLVLANMGAWADVQALLELVPADQMTPALMRASADAALSSGRTEDACATDASALKTSADVYWQQLNVFCKFAAGDTGAAAVGLDVLHEQHVEDPVYFWALDLLTGSRKPAPANLGAPAPLVLAMVRKAGVPLPDAWTKSQDLTIMAAIAALPSPEEAVDKSADGAKRDRARKALMDRIVLAEHAVALGTLDVDTLRKLYLALDLKDDPDPPQLSKLAPDDIRARAMLYQAAVEQTVPTARAEVISHAVALARLDAGEKGPDLVTVGQVYAAALGEIEVSGELVWFAGDAARALLAAGEIEKAKQWIDLAQNMGRSSIEAQTIADGLWPFERLLSPEGAMPQGAIRRWQATIPEVVQAAHRETLINLFIAVGEQIASSGSLADTGSEDGPTVRPAVWNGLTLATRGKRVGEAAALSLIALGEEGPARASPTTLQKVIESLIEVGRDADARTLAVEAALVHGL